MKLFVNFLLFSCLVVILSLATFYPVSLLRVFSPASELLVLGESTGPGGLTVASEGWVSGRVVSVSGKAYPGQNSYYNLAFRVENNSQVYQSYKIDVLKVYPLSQSLQVSAVAGKLGVITLAPGQSQPIGIMVSEGSQTSEQPFDFTAKFTIIPGVNFQ